MVTWSFGALGAPDKGIGAASDESLACAARRRVSTALRTTVGGSLRSGRRAFRDLWFELVYSALRRIGERAILEVSGAARRECFGDLFSSP
jgi:hypothetical protein